MVETLSDLVFHVRENAAGRADYLSVRHAKLETLSAGDFVTNVHALALALQEEGITEGDRVAIFSENRPEWPMVDFACHLLGIPTVPLFPNLSAEQVAFILRNSGCRLVFYSDQAKREMLSQLQQSLTVPVRMVAIDPDATAADGLSLTSLLGRGEAQRGSTPLERFRGKVTADDLASIIYTSGTTGDPKGVMLSHGNLVSNFLACAELFKVGPRDMALSVLPLSHVLQRTMDHLCLYKAVPIRYVPKLEDIGAVLQEVGPTILTAVPRLYERAYLRITNDFLDEGRFRRLLIRWAITTGHRYTAEVHGGFVGPVLALQRQIAEHLVYRRIRLRFGGRLRLAISGGAPLGREISEFFEAIGIPVFQGYGLTETAPVLATNAPGQHRLGSVGRILPQVEVRLAEDGEILAKGPGVMRGYWKNPAETQRMVDEDGWLHTGDIGEIDKSGYLFVTDRKSDLLVTSEGLNIAPQPIESLLVSHRLIAQAVVVGDGRPFPAVLLVPNFEALQKHLNTAESLSIEALVDQPETRKLYAEVLSGINGQLEEHQRLRRFRLLGRELTSENGELTPTQKVRRRVIGQRYAKEIAALYAVRDAPLDLPSAGAQNEDDRATDPTEG